jgi:TetR/AcrR family transcriptional regulator, ethionamide resistance regulator
VSPATSRQHTQARDHRAAVEAAIFEAVEAFLADHAFRDLTVEGVIAPTGLGRTAFYRYFPDLETVLLRRLDQIRAELDEATDPWLDGGTEGEDDPVAGLAAAALALAQVYRRHAALLRAFAEAAAAGADVEAAWRDLIDRFVAKATERIEGLIRGGRISVDRPDETARALVWMTERYLLESYGRGREVPVELAATTVTQVWHRTLFWSSRPPG